MIGNEDASRVETYGYHSVIRRECRERTQTAACNDTVVIIL
jgi:hypothetical protein